MLYFFLNMRIKCPRGACPAELRGHYVNRCNLRCVSCGPEDHYGKIKNDTTYQGDWCKLVKIYARKDAETCLPSVRRKESPHNPAGDLK